MDNINFVLGRASGEGCNCLIHSFQKILPTSMFDVPFVRAELERRHAGRPTAIIQQDYLDLAIYWEDIIDIIGLHNFQGVIPNFSSKFRICCVDMCWIGNGEVLPRGVPQGDRQNLYIARVNQNYFVPLLRSQRRGGEVVREVPPGMYITPDLGRRTVDTGSVQEGNEDEIKECARCGGVGHVAEHCPFFRRTRETHADAQMGDNVPHMNQVNITISADGAVVEQCQRAVGWFYHQKLEISVDNINFVLGKASGEGCNCLIYTFQKILPTRMFDVRSVRAELERHHAGRPTAIVRGDYLDLDIYWADIIDIIGRHNLQGVIPNFSSKFRICCVDMCWIGNGEVLPRGMPQGNRQTLYIARVNQNHFVPLLRSQKHGGEIVQEAPSCKYTPPDLNGASVDAGSAQDRNKAGIKDPTEEMKSANRVYPAVGPTADVEKAALKAEAARTQKRELQAMETADIEAEYGRECTPTRVHSGQASTRVATAASIFCMEAIMNGSAFDGSLEAAQVAMDAEMENDDVKLCLCSDHAPRRSSTRMPDEAELQRLQQEQQERRRRTDMLSHLRLCQHRPRKHSFEKRLEGAERLANMHLRSRVTIPATVEQDPHAQKMIDSAVSLPRIHCAFAKCTACTEEDFAEDAKVVQDIDRVSGWQDDDRHAEVFWDRVLKAHILRKHKQLIQGVAFVEEDDDVWDVYKEGLAVQERRRVPVVGAAVDRRAFETTMEVYNDDSIRSLICFVCARVCLHTSGAHSQINYRPGEWLLSLPTGIKEKEKI